MLEPRSIETLTVSDEDARRWLGNERLLSRSQAAEFLGVSPRTIDAWTANMRGRGGKRRPRVRKAKPNGVQPSREKLSFVKLGHKVFFQLGDLRAFRDQRKVAA